MHIDTSLCVRAQQLRTETRMKVALVGELSDARGARPCRIHDISRGGICVEWEERPEIGMRLTFARGALTAQGTVTWTRGRRFGLRFDAPIRATDLLVQMSHSRQARPAPIADAGVRSPSR